MQADTPTADDIKNALMARAKAFADARNISLSTVGLNAVNDSKFFSQVEKGGRGFRIDTYQRVIDWLDKAEQEAAQ